MATPSFRVKAVYDYSSPHDDDLSFPNGQIINVTDEEDADWYYGEYTEINGTKQQGLFPKNFVERYEPATPPRPSRSTRLKKEPELPPPSQIAADTPVPEEESGMDSQNAPPTPTGQVMEPTKFTDTAKGLSSTKSEPLQGVTSNTTVEAPIEKPVQPASSKAVPLVAADKPSSSSFRDRIAAFNKATAPVAPMKPSGLGQSAGSAFVKKPYVAPPPSRNAYVPPPREPPPQKVYRREEDQDLVFRHTEPTEPANAPPITESVDAAEEDQPKPTSLKERIALLQKQQLEQASRHSEAAQKKEKPKRPPKKQIEPHSAVAVATNDAGTEKHEKIDTENGARDQADESSYDEHRPRARSSTRRTSKSKETTPLASPTRVYHNDPNDADQSGAGETEDGGDISTGRDDSDERPRAKMAVLPQRTLHMSARESAAKDEENNQEEGEEDEDEEEEEEEDIDPEVKRKMEIRERMAKMSGGMGMAGMFGPPGGMPFLAKKQKTSGSSTKDVRSEQTSGSADYSTSRNQPLMALPGMQRVRSPEEVDRKPELATGGEQPVSSTSQDREADEIPDIESLTQKPSQKPRMSEERGMPPPIPQERPLPIPPPIPSERPSPPVPMRPEVQPAPPARPKIATPPSPATESDDEAAYPEQLALDHDAPLDSQPVCREAPPVPIDSAYPPSPIAPSTFNNRSSRMPPIPGSSPSMASPPQMRAPPPPLPPQAPPSRILSDHSEYHAASETHSQESEEEVTEYDGDYDTDMASSATHKDALKSNLRSSSMDEPLTGDEASYHHPGLPSLGPPPGPPPIPTAPAPRAVPPPPPNQPPKHTRQLSDMPRIAPPPPPPPRTHSYKEEEEYDPYSYVTPRQHTAGTSGPYARENMTLPRAEAQSNEPYAVSPPQQHPPSPSAPGNMTHLNSPVVPSMPRQSLDILRTTSSRRSTEATRPSIEQGFIADDVDLGRGSQWWLQRKMPPPLFQNRSDITFEVEESNATQQVTIKTVYILFIDYSQTVVTARFDTRDPSKVEFQQRHEPPPLGLRQDQLEDAHTKFGARIAEMVNMKVNSVVGDGSPFSLIMDLMNSLPAALPPVGTRAYGALVYTNLANASVQQNDEIRAGDIVTFRNAKLQGHRGPMKQKYNVEVGKPDHMAVIVDWDGTKKKVRAWEQGRESKKVKIESFKLGDLRSGEVKVWRVMAREWVGWGRGHS